MDKQNIIEYLELAAIVISGGLGIASALTETRNKKGKLTIWGILVVAGILVANTFSYLQTFLKQKQEASDREEAYKEQKKKDSAQFAQYTKQVNLLLDNVKKSDSSLQQQLAIQKQSSNILNNVRQSITVQHQIFNQSENLITQQKTVVSNMDRTLYPLLPFKVSFSLFQQVDNNSFLLVPISKLYKDKIAGIRDLVKSATSISDVPADTWSKIVSEGIIPVFPQKSTYIINSKSSSYKILLGVLTNIKISFNFFKTVPNTAGSINCEIEKDYLQNPANFKNLQFFFDPEKQFYVYDLLDLPVVVTSSLRVGAYSLRDLDDTYFNLTIDNSPAYLKTSEVTFKFPPDFSRIYQIKTTGSQRSIFNKYNTYTYSYTARTQFVY